MYSFPSGKFQTIICSHNFLIFGKTQSLKVFLDEQFYGYDKQFYSLKQLEQLNSEELGSRIVWEIYL